MPWRRDEPWSRPPLRHKFCSFLYTTASKFNSGLKTRHVWQWKFSFAKRFMPPTSPLRCGYTPQDCSEPRLSDGIQVKVCPWEPRGVQQRAVHTRHPVLAQILEQVLHLNLQVAPFDVHVFEGFQIGGRHRGCRGQQTPRRRPTNEADHRNRDGKKGKGETVGDAPKVMPLVDIHICTCGSILSQMQT